MDQEEPKHFSNYGLWIDPEELKKCSHITIWGQMWLSDGNRVGPWTPILQVPIDRGRIKRKTSLIGTYISCEV